MVGLNCILPPPLFVNKCEACICRKTTARIGNVPVCAVQMELSTERQYPVRIM